MREYSFIIDPNYNKALLYQILNILDNSNILISKNIYNTYDNIFNFTYKVNDLISYEEERLVTSIIDKIAFIPLLLTLSNTTKTNETTDLKGIGSFLIPIIEKNYGVTPDNIDQIERIDDTSDYTFIEYSFYKGGNQMYIHKNSYKYIDLSEYLGYSFISSDNLTPYVVSHIKENLNLININGLYGIGNENFDDWNDYIISSVNKLKSQQVFALKSGCKEEINAWLELAYYWKGTIRRVEDIAVIQSNIELDMTPANWYTYNGKRLISGSIPKYRFSVNDTITNQPMIKYHCVLSYLKLMDTYPELSKYVEEIEVYDDNTVELCFYEYKQVEKFKEIFEIISNIITSNQLKVKNIEEGLSIRFKLEKESDSRAVLIEHKGNYYVFSDSNLENINIDQEVSNFKFQLNDVSNTQNYGYFDGILKGVRNIPIVPELKIQDVNIYEDKIKYTEGTGVIAYNVGINENNFLQPDYNMYYILKKELNYFNEVTLYSNQKDGLLANVEVLQCIYESSVEQKEVIKKMWLDGKFLKEWSKFIYKDSKLFSRLNLIYYTE